MDKNKIILWVSVAGGAYLLYWYLKNFGPTGAAYSSTGQQIAPSYWDSWFGMGAAAVPAPTSHTATSTGITTPAANQPTVLATPVTTTSPAAVKSMPVSTAPVTGIYPSVRAAVLRAAQVPDTTTYNADQWGYYMAQAGYTLTPTQLVTAFPNITGTDRGPSMTIDQYLQALSSGGVGGQLSLSGMGAIIQTGSIPSFPSMSFGGAMSGKKGWS